MNSTDKRIEELLNRAGQTISDLPTSDGRHLTYDNELRSNAEHQVFDFAGQSGYVDVIDCLAMHQDYIIHQAEIIDRLETALENQVTLHENLMHVIGNADIPDGVSYDQFCLVVDNIYRAVQTAQEGWENYESGVPKDGGVDDAD